MSVEISVRLDVFESDIFAVSANPVSNLSFAWTFNNTSENADIQVQRSGVPDKVSSYFPIFFRFPSKVKIYSC